MPRRSSILFEVLPPRVSVALSAYKNFFFGEAELCALREFVSGGRLSIDVGAHRGVYTFFLSRWSNSVVAYEPNPGLARYLRLSVRPNVTVRNVALGESPGRGFLIIPSVDGNSIPGWAKLAEMTDGSSESYEVGIVRLDDEDLTDVGFIKIDVEGNEEAVLRGGTRTINRDHPILLIEIEQRHLVKPISESFALIEGLGYRGYFRLDGLWHPLAEFEAVLRRDPAYGQAASGKYLNNFLFWPRVRGNPPW